MINAGCAAGCAARRAVPKMRRWTLRGGRGAGTDGTDGSAPNERRTRIRRAVETLPEKFRVPVRMHYGSQMTYRQIAVALGLKESTVVGRIAGALRMLRRRMGVERT